MQRPTEPRTMSLEEARTKSAAWSVARLDSLIDDKRRHRSQVELLEVATVLPEWTATWLIGVTADVIKTLPAEDPWRNLQVIEDEHDPGLQRARVTLPDGSLFGDANSAFDLVIPAMSDLRLDIATAAIADPISPSSVVIFALSSSDWISARTYALDMYQRDLDTDGVASARDARLATSKFIRTCHDALRWALYRRRTYVGHDDPMPMLALLSWINNADELVESGASVNTETAQLIEEQKIDDGLWEKFRVNSGS